MSQVQTQPGIITGFPCGRGTESRASLVGPPIIQLNRQNDDGGLSELIDVWHRIKDRRSLDFCWRDRLEYQIIKLDHSRQQAILCPDQTMVLRRIERANGRMWLWRPGSTKFALEAANSRPHSPQLEDLLAIEQSFTRRRQYLRSLLNNDQAPFTLNALPDLGEIKTESQKSESSKSAPVKQVSAVPQRTLSMHARAQSMHVRAQSYSNISMDKTRSEPASPTSKFSRLSRPRLRSIATESHLHIPQLKSPPTPPVFYSGGRGLHVTFGCHDLREARYLHDQMCVLSPVMLAFTASTPIHKGRLCEYDVRMESIPESSDDSKTCSAVRPWRQLYPTYLGLDAPRSRITRSTTNKEVFQRLKMEGFDDAMALFCAQGYSSASPQTSKKSSSSQTPERNAGSRLFHEFTASLNPYVQLELPSPHDLRVAFRVTFAAMEIQLTDFSNAAVIFFLALLRFAILGFDLDFRLPPHMVAENLAKAHKQDSILSEQLWWRSVRWRVGFGFNSNEQPLTTDAEPSLVSIDYIINGDPSRPETVGLSGVLDAYLADVEDSSDAGSFADHNNNHPAATTSDADLETIARYLAFIRRRAKGTVPTEAKLIRNFVHNHPEYEANAPLTQSMWCDLVKRTEELNANMSVSMSLRR